MGKTAFNLKLSGIITHYLVLRHNGDFDPIGEFTTIATGTGSSATSHTDGSVEPEKYYTYHVIAVNAHGASARSASVLAETPPDATPGAAELVPSNLAPSIVQNGGVILNWDAPAVVAATVTSYQILPALGESEMTALVTDTASITTVYPGTTAGALDEVYRVKGKAIRSEEKRQGSNTAHGDFSLARQQIQVVDVQGGTAVFQDQKMAVELVSNLHDRPGSSETLEPPNRRHGQPFNAGSKEHDYDLHSIGVYVTAVTGGPLSTHSTATLHSALPHFITSR